MNDLQLKPLSKNKQSSFSETHLSQFFSYKKNDDSSSPITKKITKNASSTSYFDPKKTHSKKYSVHYNEKNEFSDGKKTNNNQINHDIIVESNPNNTFNLIVDGTKTDGLGQKEILDELQNISKPKQSKKTEASSTVKPKKPQSVKKKLHHKKRKMSKQKIDKKHKKSQKNKESW